MTPTDNRPCTCHPDMTRPDLDALAALLDKATPGHHPLSTAESATHHMANAKDEIVRALPALLAYVRELEALLDPLTDADRAAIYKEEGLTEYRVTLHEGTVVKFTFVFDCWAEDTDHAAEQALNAYPNGEVLNVSLKEDLE